MILIDIFFLFFKIDVFVANFTSKLKLRKLIAYWNLLPIAIGTVTSNPNFYAILVRKTIKKIHYSLTLCIQQIDIVYAVVYSMLLLNTDLHIVHGSNHHRMSRSSFCENTMATILNNINLDDKQQIGDISAWKQNMEVYLKETYTSVKLQGILQPDTIDKNQSRQQCQHQQRESGVATTTKSLFQRMGSLKHTSSPRRKTSVSNRLTKKKNRRVGNTNVYSYDYIFYLG
jgi:Sec7-like guanine-nucleotide exchange factor